MFDSYFKKTYKDCIDEQINYYIHRDDYETSITNLHIENKSELTMIVYATVYVNYYAYQDNEDKKCLTVKCYVDLDNKNNFKVLEIVEYEKSVIGSYYLNPKTLLPYISSDKYEKIAGEILNKYFTKEELKNYIDPKELAKRMELRIQYHRLSSDKSIFGLTCFKDCYINLYDCDGIVGMKYNGDIFFYVKDSQNNIIGLLDESGNRIVSYSYDSWGNILYIKDENNIDISDNANHIGIINPFRYKSYYYDSESGLYYLKHRYYNPEISRFISPDIILGANKDILSYNQYAYAGNNPISNYDSSGQNAVTKILVNMLVAIVSKVVKTVKKINNKNVKKPVVTGIFNEINPNEINFPIIATYGYGSNLKMESSLNSKTTSITSNTSGTSAEYRYGDLGYDVDPNSFNFFSSTTIDIATTKTKFGVDGDYFFFGYDEEIDYDETGSLSAFVRVNIRKEIVYGAVIAAYVTLAIAALKDIVVPVTKTIVVTSPSWVPHMDEVYQYVKAMT